jgi:hypothetical protein
MTMTDRNGREDTSEGLHLQAFLDIGTQLKELNLHHRRREAALIQRASDATRDVLVRYSAIIPAGGSVPTTLTAIDAIGGSGPQVGEVWLLRACRIGGLTPTTAAAGRGDLYQNVTDPNYGASSLSTANWIDQAATLPLVGTYSSRQVVLRSPDNLFIVVTNGTAGQQYVANAQFEIYKDGAYRAEITL